ncbi:MAG: hypothetical protein DYG96_08490 [Chlorobi bacterium CHB2]|nr:hypothetical protein [Chlorobi bacterium CHB2]
MMRPLVNFLNQGLLPMTDREKEATRIVAFFQGTMEAQGLRAALLSGEAGAGKSRLLEDLLPRVLREGGAVVHTKLYPESTTSITPILAQALSRSSSMFNLLRIEPEENLSSVAASLRRLAQLRPTLVIVEDIHLLEGEAEREFSTLLNALSDEPISLLCAARPTELKTRGLLERYLVEEIELEGITAEGILQLWQALFESPPDLEAARILHEVTLGNPLALRSGLRGALKSGALAHDPTRNAWRLMVPPSLFAESLGRSVRLLSEGLAAHVSATEQEAAEQLATLGELFAREAAEALLPEAVRMLDILMFKGIIAQARSTVSPLNGPPSRRPLLTFTHSLLHRNFVERARFDAARLVDLLVQTIPLYSVVPFQLLADYHGTIEAPLADLDIAIGQAFAAIVVLNRSADWPLGTAVWNAAFALSRFRNDERTERERSILQANLLHNRLRLIRKPTQERNAITAQIDALTEPFANDEELAPMRLNALAHKQLAIIRSNHQQALEIWNEVEGIAERYPSVRFTEAYVHHLRGIIISARANTDEAIFNVVEDRLNALNDGTEHQRIWKHARRIVGPYLLDIFTTQAELDRRLQLLHELERESLEFDVGLPWLKTILLYELGQFQDVLQLLPNITPRLLERGLYGNYCQAQLLMICVELGLGGGVAGIEERIEKLHSQFPTEFQQILRRSISIHLCDSAMLHGADQWAAQIFRKYSDDALVLPFALRLLLGLLDSPTLAAIKNLNQSSYGDGTDLWRLFEAAMNGEDSAQIVEQMEHLLRQPILRRDHITELCATIRFAETILPQSLGESQIAMLRKSIHHTLIAMVEWLEERGLFGYMKGVLNRFSGMLNQKELAKWRGRITALERQHEGQIGKPATRQESLSMLGSIEFRRPNQEPARPRGARLKIILGLLTADRMLEKRLTNREFYCIAAGDDDLETARTTVYSAMHRLKEIVGPDAILTDGETPELDLSRVHVDLLEAHALLTEAIAAMRESAWMRARGPLIAALDIFGNRVPFPTLYETFFEAAREDLENRIRTTAIRVGRGLLLAGDAASAESVLRRALTTIPEDEELQQLLRQTLESLGKRIEIERMKIRAEEED